MLSRLGSRLLPLVLAFGPLKASAEADFTPGAYLKVTAHYDSSSDRFLPGGLGQEAKACFQVIEINQDGLVLLHVSGPYKPWWKDEVIEPGGTDTWFNSEAYLDNRPNAEPLEMLKQEFSNVDGCPIS